MNRKIIPALLLTLTIVCSCRPGKKGDVNFEPGLQKSIIEVRKNPDEGFYWPYIVYIPQDVEENASLIFISNNTPSPSDEYSVHYNNAKMKIIQYRHLSDATGDPLVIFAIPRFETGIPGNESEYEDLWLIDPQALTRNAFLSDIKSLKRMDLQVISIIADARERLREREIAVSDKIIPFGFSSSGTFASRFALLHPENTRMVIAGAPGGWFTLPLRDYKGTSLRYPIGISDLSELLNMEFNFDLYKEIPKFYFVGTEDRDDAVPYLDSYSFEDRMSIYGLFGNESPVRYREYEELMKGKIRLEFTFFEGMNHSISEEAYEAIIHFINNSESAQ